MLKDKHRVPVTVETVIALDGIEVTFLGEFFSEEGRDKNEQCRLRQVKIRNKAIHPLEFMTGTDEYLGFAGEPIGGDGF